MHFTAFAKFALLLVGALVSATPTFPGKITTGSGNFKVIQGTIGTVAGSGALAARQDTPPITVTVGPFRPSPANLIVNKTVTQGDFADLGIQFPVEGDAQIAFDGFAKNITVFETPPGGDEEFIFGLESGPDTNLCGFFPGLFFEALLDTSVLGTYQGRWVFEIGESEDHRAAVNATTGCGPEPFNKRIVEFVRKWEVVAPYGA
ncbi:hypothetical protein FB45DRAFT_939421 [Roridomyces roridus]|uniref:Uncharacterized protein n=1 Tax=Roridomyces roridus TaxID=1738132 RepID=A0AAD7B718_9AGAR|nr:hypothetical protein FB45DRAFT_939421 [Roridomyces roridus]